MHLGVLGAGPIGLEMAASAVRRGLRVSMFERGETVGANVKAWGHVQLFSSNALNVSADGSALLREAGMALPAENAFPTGREYAAEYLEPLAMVLLQSGRVTISCGCTVLSAGRGALTKGQAIGVCEARCTAPFELLVLQGGEEQAIGNLDALVDATGTYGNPNWLGKGGRPALGERAMRANGTIRYMLPAEAEADVLLAGGSVAVIGSGASAITTLHMLRQRCAELDAALRVVWLTRRTDAPYTLIEGDPLPQRAALYQLGNDLAAASPPAEGPPAEGFQVEHRGGCHVVRLVPSEGGGVTVELEPSEGGERSSVAVRNIVAHVGFRPDAQLTAELQVHYCFASDGPMKLAAAMMAAGGGGGDCLAQVSPGPATMLNPEPGFFVVGMKSYGRGSAFLLRIGHEQVQHVLSLLLDPTKKA